jgi:uncharacterized coiled-coil protein SlyX
MSEDGGDEADFNIIQRLVRVEHRQSLQHHIIEAVDARVERCEELIQRAAAQLASQRDRIRELEKATPWTTTPPGDQTVDDTGLRCNPSESWRKLEDLTSIQRRYVIDFLEGEQADLQADIDDTDKGERADDPSAPTGPQVVSDALEIILQALRGE